MGVAFQASLIDDGVSGAVSLESLADTVERTVLTQGAWVDVRRGWVSGSDQLFGALVESVPWRAERRTMYDRVVDVPRLVRFYGDGEMLPDPVLVSARRALSGHYPRELGEPFTTAGMCFYRDGRDSVAR